MVRQLESLMKLFAGMLVLTLLAATAAQGADNPKSVALMRAMRSDEIAVATAKRNFLNGSMAERYGKTNAGCVKRIPYADFTAGWARVIDSVLSAEEIETALAFFKSDAGVKYVEGMLRRLRAREGGVVFPEVPGKEDIISGPERCHKRFLELGPRTQSHGQGSDCFSRGGGVRARTPAADRRKCGK